MADQSTHCLQQITRFSTMMTTGNFPDRSRDEAFAQMFFNLGRYVELTDQDGRKVWQMGAECVRTTNYTPLTQFAESRLA